jgi:hypothetical protein
MKCYTSNSAAARLSFDASLVSYLAYCNVVDDLIYKYDAIIIANGILAGTNSAVPIAITIEAIMEGLFCLLVLQRNGITVNSIALIN